MNNETNNKGKIINILCIALAAVCLIGMVEVMLLNKDSDEKIATDSESTVSREVVESAVNSENGDSAAEETTTTTTTTTTVTTTVPQTTTEMATTTTQPTTTTTVTTTAAPETVALNQNSTYLDGNVSSEVYLTNITVTTGTDGNNTLSFDIQNNTAESMKLGWTQMYQAVATITTSTGTIHEPISVYFNSYGAYGVASLSYSYTGDLQSIEITNLYLGFDSHTLTYDF